MFRITIPCHISECIGMLQSAGYEAYAVGGCVRDSLLSRIPDDWDVTTSATPEQTEKVFSAYRVIETGIKHGTVTVIISGQSVEITTFRIDGSYSDNRHPDTVSFSEHLSDDLSRRDFTVNAMAYSPQTGLADPFNGQADLKTLLLRCVGEPDRRFTEDALRMMRALRFSSVLGFAVEEKTSESIHRNKALLKNVSAERIFTELKKLLCGKNVYEVLMKYSDVIAVVIPEIAPEIGYNQQNPHHCYTLWEHTCVAVSRADCDITVRLALLLHDCGKPFCRSTDTDGIAHYYSHASKSAELTEKALERLRADSKLATDVVTLVRQHDSPLSPDERLIKRRLNRIGKPLMYKLIEVQQADNRALASRFITGRIAELDGIKAMTDEIISRESCFSLKDLAVNGNDIAAIGLSGKAIGRMLNALLDCVIDGEAENTTEALTAKAKSLLDAESRATE